MDGHTISHKIFFIISNFQGGEKDEEGIEWFGSRCIFDFGRGHGPGRIR
jgi:hypothetical protein